MYVPFCSCCRWYACVVVSEDSGFVSCEGWSWSARQMEVFDAFVVLYCSLELSTSAFRPGIPGQRRCSPHNQLRQPYNKFRDVMQFAHKSTNCVLGLFCLMVGFVVLPGVHKQRSQPNSVHHFLCLTLLTFLNTFVHL